MAGLDEMRIKIGMDLSGLTKGAADASKIIAGVGNAASQIAPAFAKTASAADGLQISLSKVKGFDLSPVVSGSNGAAKVFADIAKSASGTVPAFTQAGNAADALDAALEKLAADGQSKIQGLANQALGLGTAFKGVSATLPEVTVPEIEPINIQTGPAIKSIEALENELSQLQAKLKNSVDASEFTELSREVSRVSSQINSIKVGGLETGLGKVGKSSSETVNKLKAVPGASGQASAALLDLGRIAEDAPFGFIGISNNISPLLESFRRLQAESKATGTSLKSNILGALSGGAGIGLAVSVATGLLTVLAQQGFFKTEKAADDAKKKIEDFNSAVKSIYEGAGREASQVAGLVAVLESETATRGKKLDAIKELQRIQPEVFNSLKLESGAVAGLDAAYQSYLKNLETVIAAKIVQKKLEDSITQSLQFQGATSTKSIRDASAFVKGFNDAKKAKEGYVKTAGDLKYDKELAAENKRLAEQQELLKQLQDLQKGIKVPDTKDPKPKNTKDVKDYRDIIRELNEDLALNNKLASIGFISSEEQDIAKIKKVKSAIEQILNLKKGPSVDSPIITKLIASFQPEEVRKQLGERSKEIVKTLGTVGKEVSKELPQVNIPLNLRITADTKKAIGDLDRQLLEDFNKLATDIQKNILNSSLSSLGDAIGTAIGGGSIGEAFKGLFSVIISGMKQLGEAMIGLGTAKTALEKFNLLPGVGTIAAGVGIIALSSILQSALPKFADGVQGFRGGLSIVGERGPEIVQLPQGANVIPNHRLNSISGGSQIIVLDTVIKGDKLLLVHNRAEASQRRKG